LENRLKFNKVTESLKVGTFLRHSVVIISCLIYAVAIIITTTAITLTTSFHPSYHFRACAIVGDTQSSALIYIMFKC